MISYGLSLGGGGSRGAYQLGVWKALREMNIKIDFVVGTSIGAINGAFICQNKYDELLNLWLNVSVNHCFEIADIIKKDEVLNSIDIPFIVKSLINDGGLNPEPLRQLLVENIDEKLIRNSSIEFGLVTICLSSFKPLEIFIEEIPSGKLVDYIMASASLPGFKKFIIENQCFIDGGLYNNVPSIMLLNKKCTHIIEVDIEGPGLKRKVKEKNIMDFIEIKPQNSLGSILNFDPSIIKRNLQLGFLDTLRVFNHLKGTYYYFYKVELINESLLYSAEEEEIELLLKSIDYNDSFIDKLIFFRSINKLKAGARTILVNTKESILLAMEITADILNIDKAKVFSTDEMLIKIINETKYNSSLQDILLLSNCDILNHSPQKILFRRTLAVSFPKEFIAHMFLSLIKYRLNL